MKKNILQILLVVFLVLFSSALSYAKNTPSFTVHKFGSGKPHMLIVGGIQGDEPGGFSAAALLATKYKFTKGSVWIVPNLNFHSILKRSRGIYGDMNRKFASLKKNDPEYEIVSKVKDLITNKDIDLIVNLHDGSGFYRPTYETKNRNPKKWGQCIIIDLEDTGEKNGNLAYVANDVTTRLNKFLLKENHKFYVKNTKTDLGDKEMERCLTWFAIKNHKPAYAIEVSKDFNVEGRTYYHLQATESFFKHLGIEFSREFKLDLAGVKKALQDNINMNLTVGNFLPLEQIRPNLSGKIPVPVDVYKSLEVSSPILALVGNKRELKVHYGNKVLTKFTPLWYDSYNNANNNEFEVLADGIKKKIKSGEILYVERDFLVSPKPGIRINAIGATLGKNESNILIKKKNFMANYSIDKNKTMFRVEAYNNNKFVGMFIVSFGAEQFVAKQEFSPQIQ